MGAIAQFFEDIFAEDAELAETIARGESLSYPLPEPSPDRRTLTDFEGDVAIAYKMRLSGLSERSWGCGTDRRTVYHAVAIKVIERGRLQRQPHQYLCTLQGAREFGTGAAIENEITCDRCLKLINRHGLSICRDEAIARLISSY